MELIYKELNREDVSRSLPVRKVEVEREELHVRKLVDASLFQGVLYEHTSNAYENAEVVYMEPRPEKRHLLPSLSVKAYRCTMEYYDISSGTSRLIRTESYDDFAPLITRLLDHYRVISERDYELVYTILDEERGVVLAFVKPEV